MMKVFTMALLLTGVFASSSLWAMEDSEGPAHSTPCHIGAAANEEEHGRGAAMALDSDDEEMTVFHDLDMALRGCYFAMPGGDMTTTIHGGLSLADDSIFRGVDMTTSVKTVSEQDAINMYHRWLSLTDSNDFYENEGFNLKKKLGSWLPNWTFNF